MTGLQRICKLYGRMKCGDTMMVWDYANDVAVPESEMEMGSDRWQISEKVRLGQLREVQRAQKTDNELF